ncbi:hypothetical protein PVA17_16335 [Lysinibacillus sp. CNPSo 3705]|uniref:hypothetical protein n=1 Tax=Lysinibacillus sp. CNPSo 3705 TaxID=3028148 RepID=UPI0010488814|nr:hypothetical protein [Lysinibacillus sp. CNPSo 3705]MDD1504313.1 hypothetical protein [Lysinibacillus sp. CNPSo 3705]
MPFYPPNPRMRPFPPRNRQGFGPPIQGRRGQPFFYPNQQLQTSRFGRLPQHLNTIMNHAGTITNGVGMLRQMGAFLNFFR